MEKLRKQAELDSKKLREQLADEMVVRLSALEDLQTGISTAIIGKLEEERQVLLDQRDALFALRDGLLDTSSRFAEYHER